MKMKLILAACLAAATLTPVAASAQPGDRHQTVVRHSEVRHEERRHNGWNRHHPRRVCNWKWRGHHKVRVCKRARW